MIAPSLHAFYSGLHDLPHEDGGKRAVGLESDGALAGLVALELVLEGLSDSSRIERAVMLARAEPDQDLPVVAEGGHLIAEALGEARDCRVDRLAQLLERGALVRLDRSQPGVDRFRLGRPPALAGGPASSSRFRAHLTASFLARAMAARRRPRHWPRWVPIRSGGRRGATTKSEIDRRVSTQSALAACRPGGRPWPNPHRAIRPRCA